MKLVPLNQFVIDTTKPFESPDLLDFLHVRDLRLRKIEQYNEFLLKNPELWMFIPCDENGFLRKPNYYNQFLSGAYLEKPNLIDFEACKKYKEAEDRIIFHDFQSAFGDWGENSVNYNNRNLMITIGELSTIKIDDPLGTSYGTVKTINDLTDYGLTVYKSQIFK